LALATPIGEKRPVRDGRAVLFVDLQVCPLIFNYSLAVFTSPEF